MKSNFLQNGTKWMVNHSWIKAGKYIINVTATDNQTISSSQITIWIDAMNINNIGYIIDQLFLNSYFVIKYFSL